MRKTEDRPTGIIELYSPKDCEPEIDIVAVHGLSGDARKTWTAKSNRACWLSDASFLPSYIKNARVLSWGYNSSFTSLRGGHPPSKDRIHHHAQTLVANLSAERSLTETEGRPIIFICHSLGGLVVKRALSYAQSKTGHKVSHQHDIFTCTYGILFFGTPHNGTAQATYLNYLTRVASAGRLKALNLTDSSLVAALKEESETLQNITEYFVPIMKNFSIHFFWEQEKTDLNFGKQYIVTSESAAPVHDETERSGIAATHSDMVKFHSPADQGFRTVISTLKRYCDEAPGRIAQAKAYEKEVLHLRRQHEADSFKREYAQVPEDISKDSESTASGRSRVLNAGQVQKNQGRSATWGYAERKGEDNMIAVPRQLQILNSDVPEKSQGRSGTWASSDSRASTLAVRRPMPRGMGVLPKGRVLFGDDVDEEDILFQAAD